MSCINVNFKQQLSTFTSLWTVYHSRLCYFWWTQQDFLVDELLKWVQSYKNAFLNLSKKSKDVKLGDEVNQETTLAIKGDTTWPLMPSDGKPWFISIPVHTFVTSSKAPSKEPRVPLSVVHPGSCRHPILFLNSSIGQYRRPAR